MIFVATKEGVEGPIKVSVRFENSLSMPPKNIELAGPITYMLLGNEASRTRDPLAPLPYSQEKIENTIAGNNPELHPTTDWLDELFSDFAVNKRLNFSLSGSGGTARYYLSVAGRQDLGVLNIPAESSFDNNVNFTSYNFRSNTNVKLTKTSKLKLSFNANFETYNGPRQGGSDVYQSVLRTNPVAFSPFYQKDEANEFTNHILFGNELRNGNLLINPYADMVSGIQERTSSKFIAQLEFNQDLAFITDGFKYRMIFNTTKDASSRIDRFYRPFYYQPSLNSATGLVGLRQLNPEDGTEFLDFTQSGKAISTTTYLESNFSYNKAIDDKNEISGLVVFTLNNRTNTLTDGQLSDPNLNNSHLTKEADPTNDNQLWKATGSLDNMVLVNKAGLTLEFDDTSGRFITTPTPLKIEKATEYTNSPFAWRGQRIGGTYINQFGGRGLDKELGECGDPGDGGSIIKFVFAESVLSTDEASIKDMVELHPNPFTDSFTFNFKNSASDKAAVNVYSVTGSLVKSKTASISNNRVTVDGKSLARGLYIVEIKTTEGKANFKLLKQ